MSYLNYCISSIYWGYVDQYGWKMSQFVSLERSIFGSIFAVIFLSFGKIVYLRDDMRHTMTVVKQRALMKMASGISQRVAFIKVFISKKLEVHPR